MKNENIKLKCIVNQGESFGEEILLNEEER